MPGIPADDLVARVLQRGIVFIAQAVVESQVVGHFPGILAKKVQRMRANAVDRVGKLIVVVEEAADKIRQRAPCKRTALSEGETSIVVEIEIEVVLNPAQIAAKLQVMFAFGPGNRVLILIRHVVNLRRSLRRWAQVKVAGDGHQRRGSALRIVGSDGQKSQLRGRSRRSWDGIVSGGAVDGEAQLIHQIR